MLAVSKRPEDRLDYDLDFEKWLSPEDVVQSAEAIARIKSADAEAETDLIVDSVSIFGTIVKVWVSAGHLGATYVVKVIASTASGRVKEKCFVIRIRGC